MKSKYEVMQKKGIAKRRYGKELLHNARNAKQQHCEAQQGNSVDTPGAATETQSPKSNS
jgi:hypothetical protein